MKVYRLKHVDDIIKHNSDIHLEEYVNNLENAYNILNDKLTIIENNNLSDSMSDSMSGGKIKNPLRYENVYDIIIKSAQKIDPKLSSLKYDKTKYKDDENGLSCNTGKMLKYFIRNEYHFYKKQCERENDKKNKNPCVYKGKIKMVTIDNNKPYVNIQYIIDKVEEIITFLEKIIKKINESQILINVKPENIIAAFLQVMVDEKKDKKNDDTFKNSAIYKLAYPTCELYELEKKSKYSDIKYKNEKKRLKKQNSTGDKSLEKANLKIDSIEQQLELAKKKKEILEKEKETEKKLNEKRTNENKTEKKDSWLKKKITKPLGDKYKKIKNKKSILGATLYSNVFLWIGVVAAVGVLTPPPILSAAALGVAAMALVGFGVKHLVNLNKFGKSKIPTCVYIYRMKTFIEELKGFKDELEKKITNEDKTNVPIDDIHFTSVKNGLCTDKNSDDSKGKKRFRKQMIANLETFQDKILNGMDSKEAIAVLDKPQILNESMKFSLLENEDISQGSSNLSDTDVSDEDSE